MRKTSRITENTMSTAGRIGFLLLVYGPVLALSIELFELDASELASLVIPSGRRGSLFLNSLSLAALTAVLAMALSILAGTYLWRNSKPRAVALRWLLLMMVPVPAYIHVYAWSPIFTSSANWAPGRLVSQAAAVWVQVMAVLPVGVLLVFLSLESVDAALVEAARISRSPERVWRAIILPLCRPVLAAGAGLLAVFALLDYSVPYLFSVSTYSLELFTEFSARSEPARVLALSLPLVLVCAAVLVLSQGPLHRVALGYASEFRGDRRLTAGGPNLSWQRIGVVAVLLQIAVALFSLITSIESPGVAFRSLADARWELALSLALAAVAALASLVVAYPVARAMCRGGGRGKLWWLVAVLPLGIPPPLLGIGLITLWNRPLFDVVYDTPLVLLAALLARFTPIAAILLAAFRARIDVSLVEAASVFQASPWRRWRDVELPLARPGILAAAGVVFAFSFGEIGSTLLVAPPGYSTLPMRIYNYLHYGAGEVVGSLCMAQALIVMAGIFLVLRLTKNSGGAP